MVELQLNTVNISDYSFQFGYLQKLNREALYNKN